MFPLIKKLLFQLDPERAHNLTLKALHTANSLGLLGLYAPPSALRDQPRSVMGLSFPNPVGIASGFDKNGVAVDALFSLGFGFVEVGTLTPRPQGGNPQPRLFRLKEHHAVINRMGFNNGGIDAFIERAAQFKRGGLLAVNVGKNGDTPIESASADYVHGLRRAAPVADFIVLNISSPNTVGLRSLQYGEHLEELLGSCVSARDQYTAESSRRVPLAVKLAPDNTDEELSAIAGTLIQYGIDGVIATNTTVSRDGVDSHPYAFEKGGLSGPPLRALSTSVIRKLHTLLDGKIPIIGCGGISSSADAEEKLRAGACLLQAYTGLIYQGPKLIGEMLKATKKVAEEGRSD